MGTAITPAPEARSGRGLVVFSLALLAGLALAWYLRALVLLVYAGVLFASLIAPMVEWVEGRAWLGWRPRHAAALALVLIAALVVLALVLGLMLPPLWRDLAALAAAWPQATARVLGAVPRVPGLRHLDVADLQGYAAAAGGWVWLVAQRLAGELVDAFTVLLVTVYLMIEGRTTLAWCLRFLRPAPRQRLQHTLERAERRMRGWLLGQSTLALAMGVASAVVFGLLGLPDFYVLALLAALLTFVPFLGPLVAALIAAVVAGTQSWTHLGLVLAFFALYELFENAVLAPRILRKAVDLPGLAVILALAAGGALGGVLGGVLAVPSAVLAAELLGEYALQPE
ncbi:MAG: AI-2E family transporter [Terriglobales bacterium]